MIKIRVYKFCGVGQGDIVDMYEVCGGKSGSIQRAKRYIENKWQEGIFVLLR